MTTPKKAVKSSRAAKAEFDRVITALEKENEVFHTSPDQCKCSNRSIRYTYNSYCNSQRISSITLKILVIMFFVTGILSSVGPG